MILTLLICLENYSRYFFLIFVHPWATFSEETEMTSVRAHKTVTAAIVFRAASKCPEHQVATFSSKGGCTAEHK